MSEITAAQIQELYEDRKDYLSGLHAEIRANRDARFQRDMSLSDIPENYRTTAKLIKLDTIPNLLQRVQSTLTTDMPSVHMPPASENQVDKDSSSLLERHAQALIRQTQREAGRPVYAMGIDSAVSNGLAVWKCVDKRDVWNGLPERKKDENGEPEDAGTYTRDVERAKKSSRLPLVWTDPDPLTYFWSPDGVKTSDQ
jgi:hypothetical protein